ncbi:hypothetical protein ABZ816_31035 [Actinosynnema sp. NPDC047251]|uniref:hypothetical protein n=1 Tax=Saccharothrix espanaensis TaxID=103731 RepID=UPI0002E219EB|nr:hypothetical protein [Saccharothrix espanaensis]
MVQREKMSKDVLLAYTMMGVLSAIGLVVVLNGGSVVLAVGLWLAGGACGAYVVRQAVKRFR